MKKSELRSLIRETIKSSMMNKHYSRTLQVTSENGRLVLITDPKDIEDFLAGEEVYGEDNDGGLIGVSIANALDYQMAEGMSNEAIKENKYIPMYKGMDVYPPSYGNSKLNVIAKKEFNKSFLKLEPQQQKEVIKIYKTGVDPQHPVNENDYPTSAPRVYVLMLGNRSRGTSGPYRIYADKAAAEAEAAKQEAEGKDTRAFVQDLPFIK
jgi:hypothetical protein